MFDHQQDPSDGEVEVKVPLNQCNVALLSLPYEFGPQRFFTSKVYLQMFFTLFFIIVLFITSY